MGNITITKNIKMGNKQPLVLIAGPCVLEKKEICYEIIETLQGICQDLGINYIFKASFDKANRTNIHSYRGIGIKKSLQVFTELKEKYNIPILTDIHEANQAKEIAKVVDFLQIPALLCRQTDLILAASKTGKATNIKKGQFLAPQDMKNVVEKFISTGNKNVSLCERGTVLVIIISLLI